MPRVGAFAACVVLAASSAAAAAAAHAGDSVRVTVGAPLPGVPAVASNYVSLSTEISDALGWLGTNTSLNLPFRNLMQVLRNVSMGAGPSLRIGGNSAEFSVYAESGPLPPNQTYRITQRDLYAYAAALPAWAGRAVLDTTLFFPNDTTYAVAHAAAVTAHIGWELFEAVEIGNEVEIFHDAGVRPRSWSVADYELEFAAHVVAMEAAGMPHGRIQGFVLCCNNSDYDARWAGYASEWGAAGVLTSMSYHHYAVGGCEGKGPNVTAAMLLADSSSVGSRTFLAPYVASSRAAGLPFRVGEGNSVSCGGRSGVSDAFASALWALDTLLELAALGVEMFNFHGGGDASYSAVTFPNQPASNAPDVRPLFYGMWAATVATQSASVPLAVTLSTSNAAIKAHALRDAAGATRSVLVHKDLDAAASTASVAVCCGAPGGSGSLVRLETASGDVANLHNVTFMGLTFDGAADGLPIGTPVSEDVPVGADGVLRFTLPPRSAAILTFRAAA